MMTNKYAAVSERSLDAPGLGQKPRVYSQVLKSGERVEIPRFDAGKDPLVSWRPMRGRPVSR
jgi:hypothetical protein